MSKADYRGWLLLLLALLLLTLNDIADALMRLAADFHRLSTPAIAAEDRDA